MMAAPGRNDEFLDAAGAMAASHALPYMDSRPFFTTGSGLLCGAAIATPERNLRGGGGRSRAPKMRDRF